MKRIGTLIFFLSLAGINRNVFSLEKSESIHSEVAPMENVSDCKKNNEILNFDLKNLVGEYQGSICDHIVADFKETENPDTLSVLVHWGGTSIRQWTMNVKIDYDWLQKNGDSGIIRLVYSDCECHDVQFDESGDHYKEVYSNECGYFEFHDGVIEWNGTSDSNCKGCIFKRYMIFEV